jgi:hypothetical protein
MEFIAIRSDHKRRPNDPMMEGDEGAHSIQRSAAPCGARKARNIPEHKDFRQLRSFRPPQNEPSAA